MAKTLENGALRYLAYVFMNVVPIVLVVIGNTLIVFTLKQQNKRVQPELNSQPRTTNRRSATKMLFTLSVFFIFTTAPYCVFLLFYTETVAKLTPQSNATIQLCYAVTSILLFCNYTFNFYLYFISGSIFKQEWNTIVWDFKKKISNSYQTCRLNRQINNSNITNITVL